MRQFDERVYVRYNCAGEVRLHLVGKTTETLAQILNVSLGGCLLGFPSDSNLITGDDLELAVRIGKTSFHARAWVVAGANHRERVGVIFASMTPQSREALNGLIEELSTAGDRSKPTCETLGTR